MSRLVIETPCRVHGRFDGHWYYDPDAAKSVPAGERLDDNVWCGSGRISLDLSALPDSMIEAAWEVMLAADWDNLRKSDVVEVLRAGLSVLTQEEQ